MAGPGRDLAEYWTLTKSKITARLRSVPSEPAELLRRHGVQVTAQRLAVLRAVSDTAHATADVIAESVRARIGTISRQAVYDSLGVLAEKGIIRRIQPAGSPARYEGRVGDNHHHLVCRTCGRLADVDCATGETPCLVPVDDGSFVVDEAEVIYWGICPTCQPAAS
jgi:Fur family transcriptional regulator, stress-responsive regulator